MNRLLLVLGATLGVASSLPAQAPLPPGVDLVPTNAAGFATIKVSEVWDSETLKPIREAFAKQDPKLEAQIEKVLGVTPKEIDRVTVFWPTVNLDSVPVLIVTTRQPYNEAKVLKALTAIPANFSPFHPAAIRNEAIPVPKTPTYEAKGPIKSAAPPPPESKSPEPCTVAAENEAQPVPLSGDFFELQERRPFLMLYLLDERTLIYFPNLDQREGTTLVLLAQLLKRKPDGPLAKSLSMAGQHTFAMAFKLPSLEMFQTTAPPYFMPYRALTRTQSVSMTADLGATAKLVATLSFPDDASAKRAEPVLKTLIQSAEEELTQWKKDIRGEVDFGRHLVPLVDLTQKALAQTEVKQAGSTVVATTTADLGPAVAQTLAILPQRIQGAADRAKATNNLKQIGISIHNYHDAMNAMPTDILGPTGKPLLSWRVQILPYLEQDALFKSIDMTKPWDDPVNLKLAEAMPSIYQVPGRSTPGKGMTYFQMPTGVPRAQKQAFASDPFKVHGVRRNFATITDGLSNTFMVVEATDAVNWMKPDDLIYDPKKVPKLGDPVSGRFLALFGDGSVSDFKTTSVNNMNLHSYFTISGGEVIVDDRR